MTPFAQRVYDVLEQHTVSPWNVLKVECGWRGIDPLMLEPHTFEPLIHALGRHVARMTDDDNASTMVASLRSLI